MISLSKSLDSRNNTELAVDRKVHDTLRDQIVSNLKSLVGRNGPNPGSRNAGSRLSAEQAGASNTFWALRDVSFEVKRGEVLGIIGRNGAGKSTLLKILSRITEPTHGRIEIEGRVSSLLEVGTGFHPELTGRENVYMNGVILGMTRVEITRRFDEIVAFAEVEQFIDTPVKRYSSGMYLQLAFAVAAHLEPDILIVDEVLAVGDAAFQKKCLGKMAGVAKEGRTIFFVSHNMPAITRLCERAIYLEEGKLRLDGSAHQVVKACTTADSARCPRANGSILARHLVAKSLAYAPCEFERKMVNARMPSTSESQSSYRWSTRCSNLVTSGCPLFICTMAMACMYFLPMNKTLIGGGASAPQGAIGVRRGFQEISFLRGLCFLVLG